MTFDEAQSNVALMAIKKVLKFNAPKSVYELLVDCGLPLKFVSSGQFRNVFEVVGTPYVLKFPIPDDEGEYRGDTPNILHSEQEFKTWKKMLKAREYKAVRKYLPFFHYYDHNTGLSLMDKFTPLTYTDKRFEKDIDFIHNHLTAQGHVEHDVAHDKWDNYGIDKDGQLRLLDLGCIELEDNC